VALAKSCDAVRLTNGHRMGRPQTAAMRGRERAIADAWGDFGRTDSELTPYAFLRRVSHHLGARFDQLHINRGRYRPTNYGGVLNNKL
jgi:hypothetical protein